MQVINKTGMVGSTEEGFQRVLDNTEVIIIIVLILIVLLFITISIPISSISISKQVNDTKTRDGKSGWRG